MKTVRSGALWLIALTVGSLIGARVSAQREPESVRPAYLQRMQNLGVKADESGHPAYLPPEWGYLVAVERTGANNFTLFLQSTDGPTEAQLDGAFPARELCGCLLKAKRASEQAGRLDFSPRLEVAETSAPPWAHLSSPSEAGRAAETPWVALTAQVVDGPAYTVGRIEFLGHHSVSDATLRRALALHEGDMFDLGRLRRSLARLNQFSFLEPPAEGDVRMERDLKRGTADLTLRLTERPRGRWTFSGPLGAGPLHYSIGTRLPAWGRGPLELSTYVVSFHLLAFSFPALEAVSLVPRTLWLPLVGVQRPYLPGQRWQSGFFLAPQLGWQGTVTSYVTAQARQAATEALSADVESPQRLAVPVMRVSESNEAKPAGVLLCEAPPPRLAWLRGAALTAMDVVLSRGAP